MAFSTLYGFVASCYCSLATPVGLDPSLVSTSQEITISFSCKVLWNEQSGFFNRIDIYVYSPRCVMLILLILWFKFVYLETGELAGPPISGAIYAATSSWHYVIAFSGTIQIVGSLCLLYGRSKMNIRSWLLIYFTFCQLGSSANLKLGWHSELPSSKLRDGCWCLMYILDFGWE
jgi:hypothetical protein